MIKCRLTLLLVAAAFVVSGSITLFDSGHSAAISASGFNAGNIIDDALFYDGDSMTAAQVQDFLNSKVPTCDTDGSLNVSYYYNSSTGKVSSSNFSGASWVTTTRKIQGQRYDSYYGTTVGATPFTCLKDYRQNTPAENAESGICGYIPAYSNHTAAQIITDVGSACGVSPKALIVLLQKEQGLVTDDWPWVSKYQMATGYGCPDSTGCQSEYYGFFNQVWHAAAQFKRYRADPSNWNYVAGQNNYILYNPDTSCGGSWVYIKNQATAGLYDYTPYQPNTAALNAGYGIGDSCSAYGNRNFWLYYNDWFGSTKFPQPIGAELDRQSSTGKIYLVILQAGSTSTRYYIPSWSIMQNYRLSSYGTIATSDATLNSMTNGGTLSNLIRDDSGNIYLVNNGVRYHITGPSLCTAWALDCFNSNVTHNLGATFQTSFLSDSGSLPLIAKYGGVYYKMENGLKRPFANSQSVIDSGYTTSQALAATESNIGNPPGKLIVTTAGVIKFSPSTTLYYYDGQNFWDVPDMGVYNAWQLNHAPAINAPVSSYNSTDTVPVYATLSQWSTDSSSQKYVVDGGVKYKLTAAQEAYWASITFSGAPDKLLADLSTKTLGAFIKTGINFYHLSPDPATKDYIASVRDFWDLGGSDANTTHLSLAVSSQIPAGPIALPNGRLVKIDSGINIYAVYNHQLLLVASMDALRSYHFTSTLRTYSSALFKNGYPVAGTLRAAKKADGSFFYPYNGALLTLSASQVSSFGAKTGTLSTIDDTFTANAHLQPMTVFLRDGETGNIYYASGGSLHYVSSLDSFYAHGGRSTPLTAIPTDCLGNFVMGSSI